MPDRALPIPEEAITRFSERWRIRELALFGSILRDDFGPESDIDALVTFDEGTEWGLLAHLEMQRELATLLGRNVDLVSRRAVERSANWMRREHILQHARTIYPTTASEAQHAAR
jgi:predicted nucleotidyltransferase